MAALYLTELRTDPLQKPLRLNVQTDSPQQAAQWAGEHWIRNQINLNLSAESSVEVHEYQSDGEPNPSILFRLGPEVLEEQQREHSKTIAELKIRHNAIVAYRSAVIAQGLDSLDSGCFAVTEIDALTKEFERGIHDHPNLRATVSADGATPPQGPDTLLFLALASRAAGAVGRKSNDWSWQDWLQVVVAYLLANDNRGEFITKCEIVSQTDESPTSFGESYSINNLFRASQLCCLWLRSRAPVATISRSGIPEKGNQKLVRHGKEPVRRNPKYRQIDMALKKIAESRPRTQEEIFDALEGRRVPYPLAEPFLSGRGWKVGFSRHREAARGWLSKRWSELNLPPLPRGPKIQKIRKR